ncbi:rRNA pseudouridine synthase [bacterium]|jgi:23S rRNA pseudouridine2605 synthase|nr:rRNA pseudouridine synthase [bacterium]
MRQSPLLSFLSNNSSYSRRDLFAFLKDKQVKVNQVVVTDGSMPIIPNQDVVKVGRQIIKNHKKVYFKFNKPVGVVNSLNDPKHRKDLKSYIKKCKEPVFPVGRLDMDSEGLLLFTNNGELANQIMHPKFEIEKKYVVVVKKDDEKNTLKFKSELLPRLEKGLFLDDGPIAFKSALFLKKDTVEVVLTEGRNRIIRRVFQHFGYEVVSLKRIEIGSVKLNQLKAGQMTELSLHELKSLQSLMT